jgi:hypothetical protein
MVTKTTFLKLATITMASLLCNACTQSSQKAQSVPPHPIEESTCAVDSTRLPFLFYPERWTASGNILWVVNSRDTPFLTGYDVATDSVVFKGGSIGNGPGEFIFPGIVEHVGPTSVTLYSNTQNKVVFYKFDNTLEHADEGHFPTWNKKQYLPKPYTRIAEISEHIAIGTYFFPREVGAEIIDLKAGKLIASIPLNISQDGERPSGPREFKVAANSSYCVMAYRYLNQLDFYDISNPKMPTLYKSIHIDSDQTTLYEQDRDDEMIKYYSDIQLDTKNAYVLNQSVAEGKLMGSCSHLQIFNLKDGKNIANIKLDKFYQELILMPSAHKILLYSPTNEDYLFSIDYPQSANN